MLGDPLRILQIELLKSKHLRCHRRANFSPGRTRACLTYRAIIDDVTPFHSYMSYTSGRSQTRLFLANGLTTMIRPMGLQHVITNVFATNFLLAIICERERTPTCIVPSSRFTATNYCTNSTSKGSLRLQLG